MMLLSKGIPEVMESWRMNNFLDTVGCKILLYCSCFGWSQSICTTCFLSTFQAVTISPSNSQWARLKDKAPRSIALSFLLFWVLSLFLDITALMYITDPQNQTSVRKIFDLKYCSSVSVSAGITVINSAIFTLRDLLFIGIMSGASFYVVFLLPSHHSLVWHLHISNHSPRTMPEVRAAKCVISLVTLYVILYGSNTITLNVLLNTKAESPLLLNIHTVLSFLFSAISPLPIINSKRTLWQGRFSQGKEKSPLSASTQHRLQQSPVQLGGKHRGET
uniref:Vomeronasal type-1 receptor n=1 Tax=Ornithorhynchus anatinus TaxID=9258 RepID=A0A6I8NUX2_ORNAN